MASPSAWGTSWKTKTTVNESAALTVSCSCYTSSSSIFYISLTKRNQTHVTKFSLDQTPNPQISKDDKIVFKNKPIHSTVEPEAASSSSSSLLKDENFMNSGQVIGKKRGNGILVNRKGSRPLWRRIFFASKKVRSIILINVITLVYASNIPVIKEVEAIIDPAVFTVVRFTMSAIPFIPFIIKARGDTQLRAAGLELGVWVSLGYLMQALGLLTSDAGRASFLSLFTVILVPLLDGMLGATVPAYTWFGALISLLGVGMLESSGSPPCLGDLWNFLSAVFFGIHMLRTEHISRNTKKSNFLALLGYEVCVISVFSIMWFSIGGGFSSESGWDPEAWTWTSVSDWIVRFPWIPALYTGIFSTGVCLWVEMAAMRDVSATETAIIYGLEPLWGAGFAWFLLGERWGLIGWIGAALVLGGSLTVQIFGSLPPTKSSDERSSGHVDPFLVSSKPNALSASPIVVSSRKDVQDRVKKK